MISSPCNVRNKVDKEFTAASPFAEPFYPALAPKEIFEPESPDDEHPLVETPCAYMLKNVMLAISISVSLRIIEVEVMVMMMLMLMTSVFGYT